MQVNPADLIDLNRYPILAQNQTAFQHLCAQARSTLNTQSVVVLPNFIRPDALQHMQQEARLLTPFAHHMDVSVPIYPEHSEDEQLPETHVRRVRFHTSVRAVSLPHIPQGSALRGLYEWAPLRPFVAALLGVNKLYRYEDPYGALNLAVMSEGDEFGWHFDQADFVVTLVLQEPEAGGVFRCCHGLRSDTDHHDHDLQAVIENRYDAISTVPMHMGSFILFKGRQALHSVTSIQGHQSRIVALFAYDTQPGTVCSPALLKARYGIAVPEP